MACQDLEDLRVRLARFAAERDWDQFHSPKNIAMALVVEAGELVEQFQWLTEEQSRNLSPAKLEQVAQEIADVQVFLIRIADKLGVDIFEAVRRKMVINEAKYPADKVRGLAKKYTEY